MRNIKYKKDNSLESQSSVNMKDLDKAMNELNLCEMTSEDLGSIRRYLDYFFPVLTSEVISLRASFDMFAYLLEFVVPVLLVIQICIQSFNYIKGYE